MKKIELGTPTGTSDYIIEKRINKISRYINLVDKTILDFGCGDGKYSNYLHNLGNKVWGIEIEKKRLNKAKLFKNKKLDFKIYEGGKIPFKKNSFDIVILNEVLEHVKDENMTLIEIKRVLKKDGIIILYVPNRNFPLEGHGMDLFGLKVNFPIPFLPWLPFWTHKYFFRARTYSKLRIKMILEKNGYNILGIEYLFPPLDQISIAPFREGIRNVFDKLENSFLKIFGMSILIIGEIKNE